MALVATEVAGRFQRDGVAHDPMAWMLAPRAPFGGASALDAYVVRETTALADQLRAIADGGEVPPRDAPPPPIGLDPRRGGGRG